MPRTIPAFTAYLEPDNGGARVSSRSGLIQNWTNPQVRVLWFGSFTNAGNLDASIQVRLGDTAESKLRLTVSGESRDLVVRGQDTNVVTARFGRFTLPQAGYHRFTLESLNPPGQRGRRRRRPAARWLRGSLRPFQSQNPAQCRVCPPRLSRPERNGSRRVLLRIDGHR